MIPQLSATPRWYHSVETCKKSYNEFKEAISFGQPLPPFDQRYENRLESILGSVQQTYGGEQLYPTVAEAAGAYYYKICCSHAFYNGNKRLGILFTHVFLLDHGVDFSFSTEVLYLLTEELVKMSEQGVPHSDIERVCKRVILEFCVPKLS